MTETFAVRARSRQKGRYPMDNAEQQLRWSAAWWIGHGIIGLGTAVLATAIFGKNTKVPMAVLGLVLHHALDTPLAVKLYQHGV
jgi:hypothetical protein